MGYFNNLIWSDFGIFGALRDEKEAGVEKTLDLLLQVFVALNEKDGALIFELSLLDAQFLYAYSFDAEAIADRVLKDPNASGEALALALRLKLEISRTRMYLMMRDDHAEVRAFSLRPKEEIEKMIPPIVEDQRPDERGDRRD